MAEPPSKTNSRRWIRYRRPSSSNPVIKKSSKTIQCLHNSVIYISYNSCPRGKIGANDVEKVNDLLFSIPILTAYEVEMGRIKVCEVKLDINLSERGSGVDIN